MEESKMPPDYGTEYYNCSDYLQKYLAVLTEMY